jgi:AraC-like DNA-binding protein
MPGSHASVFGDSDEFVAALRPDGVVGLLVTGRGQFRAHLTQIALHRTRLVSAQEREARIAFVAVPADAVLVALANRAEPLPAWGGVGVGADEIITFGPRQRLHAKTGGPCRWESLLLPHEELLAYGRALRGSVPVHLPAARWRPSRSALRRLRHFHRAAIRMAEARLGSLADNQAAHGLEQQLIHVVIDCLAEGTAHEETKANARHRRILARFEDLLVEFPICIPEMLPLLGVSRRTLNQCCKKHLGMTSSRYRDLRLLQQANRAPNSQCP